MGDPVRTAYVGFKFPHMGVHAGYDLVRSYADYDYFIDCQGQYDKIHTYLLRKSLIARVYARIFGGYMLNVELRCLWLALLKRNIVFHFIYAENCYRYLGYFKWLGFKIVCTYHQPSEFFDKEPVYLKGLSFVDEVIVLSQEAKAYFSRIVDPQHVHFIPHGVDAEYFSPASRATSDSHEVFEVLMVGNWLRNFEFANAVFAELLEDEPRIVVHVVTLERNAGYFANHPRLVIHSNISDDELLFRYREASLLFLPLNGYVANNAVLEMASIGKPVLIASPQVPEPDLQAIVSHLPLDKEAVIGKIRDLISGESSRPEVVRRYVLDNFSWKSIGLRIKNVLMRCN